MTTRVVSTYSIVACDLDAGQWGVAVQSKFLAVGAVVPWAEPDAGAVATQSYANPRYGPDGLALLRQGLAATEVVRRLTEADDGRDQRQVGLVDAAGRAETYTGSACHDWAGGRTGAGYATQGNILVSAATVDALAVRFESSTGTLAGRLLESLAAGQEAGGDSRGQQSAALLTEHQATVVFAQPLEVEDALFWAGRRGAQVTQIEHEWVFGSEDTVTGGYVVDPTQDVAANYRLTMGDIFTGLADDLAADPNVTATDRQHAADIAYQFQSGSAPVTLLNVIATSSEIDAMRADSSVLGVTSTADSTPSNGSENACTGDWWPRVGTIRTGPLPAVPRYRRVYQWFRWDSERLANLKCKHSKVTYEAEFWSDNFDRLHYLGQREGFASNLPNAYLDNEALNPEGQDELGFTVGSNDALRLVARTSGYYTLIATRPGNATSDVGRVSAQWGFRRWTTWCRFGPAWCTFPGGTNDDLLRLYDLPGSRGWSGSA